MGLFILTETASPRTDLDHAWGQGYGHGRGWGGYGPNPHPDGTDLHAAFQQGLAVGKARRDEEGPALRSYSGFEETYGIEVRR